MNSGKSTALLQAAYNYEERGHAVVLAKPAIDHKGGEKIVSRLGVSRTVDYRIEPYTAVYETFTRYLSDLAAAQAVRPSALLIDEAQFLTHQQVDDVLRIVLIENIPVLAYGIRTDFQTVAFPGSRRLLEVAHSLEELKTICSCGRKAIFNARIQGGEFVFCGTQVAIDDTETQYEALCGKCYLKKSSGRFASSATDAESSPYISEPDADFM